MCEFSVPLEGVAFYLLLVLDKISGARFYEELLFVALLVLWPGLLAAFLDYLFFFYFTN
jgi:hypothetical protein